MTSNNKMPLSSLQTIKQEIKDKDYTIIDNNRQCRTTREIELESDKDCCIIL